MPDLVKIIGSCDFTVEGKYSYAEKPDDGDLTAFSIAPDVAGFDSVEHPGIREPGYDLLPMIQEALAVKRAQEDRELRIIASAWTAPFRFFLAARTSFTIAFPRASPIRK